MLEISEQWVLLWSKKQGCFHIEPACELVEKNLLAFLSNRAINDYHPLWIGDRVACDAMAHQLRTRLNARRELRDVAAGLKPILEELKP
jgi:hypothetical protein